MVGVNTIVSIINLLSHHRTYLQLGLLLHFLFIQARYLTKLLLLVVQLLQLAVVSIECILELVGLYQTIIEKLQVLQVGNDELSVD